MRATQRVSIGAGALHIETGPPDPPATLPSWLWKLVFLALFSLSVAGCSRTATDLSFDASGRILPLQVDHSIGVSAQGHFLSPSSPAVGPRTTLRFTIHRAPPANGTANAFYLTYETAGDGPLELHLELRAPGSGQAHADTYPLPRANGWDPHPRREGSPPAGSGGALLRYLVPVQHGSRVVSFHVTSPSAKARIHIVGAGMAPIVPGVDFSRGLLSIGRGVEVEARGATTTIRFPKLVADLVGKQAQIRLTYNYHEGAGTIDLTAVGAGGKRRSYRLTPHPGSHPLYLYTASCGFTPQAIEVHSTNPGFRLESVAVHPFATPKEPAASPGATGPIPAGFGTMLGYSPSWWRQAPYELFSWNVFPSVLVMKFRSYAVQARYMKRLAFYIEKAGYVGRLLTNGELHNRHGWNAHDYRPQDLARFYSTAAREHFPLNPEEKQLRAILVANGLLRPAGDAYVAGHGAILAFAEEGPLWLRRMLLTHEGYHGIFFTHPSYRKAVSVIWNATDPREQLLFRNVFLAYLGYDTADPYLVKNEFQAYLMQQPISRAQGFFDNELDVQMPRMGIGADSPLARYRERHPNVFRTSAAELQQALERSVGLTAADLVGLSPS